MFHHLDDLERLQTRPPRRIIIDRMDPFHCMSEEEFLSRFRLTKESTQHIINSVNPYLPQLENKRGIAFSSKLFHASLKTFFHILNFGVRKLSLKSIYDKCKLIVFIEVYLFIYICYKC